MVIFEREVRLVVFFFLIFTFFFCNFLRVSYLKNNKICVLCDLKSLFVFLFLFFSLFVFFFLFSSFKLSIFSVFILMISLLLFEYMTLSSHFFFFFFFKFRFLGLDKLLSFFERNKQRFVVFKHCMIIKPACFKLNLTRLQMMF